MLPIMCSSGAGAGLGEQLGAGLRAGLHEELGAGLVTFLVSAGGLTAWGEERAGSLGVWQREDSRPWSPCT